MRGIVCVFVDSIVEASSAVQCPRSMLLFVTLDWLLYEIAWLFLTYSLDSGRLFWDDSALTILRESYNCCEDRIYYFSWILRSSNNWMNLPRLICHLPHYLIRSLIIILLLLHLKLEPLLRCKSQFSGFCCFAAYNISTFYCDPFVFLASLSSTSRGVSVVETWKIFRIYLFNCCSFQNQIVRPAWQE